MVDGVGGERVLHDQVPALAASRVHSGQVCALARVPWWRRIRGCWWTWWFLGLCLWTFLRLVLLWPSVRPLVVL